MVSSAMVEAGHDSRYAKFGIGIGLNIIPSPATNCTQNGA
jgi:hypothetical protein